MPKPPDTYRQSQAPTKFANQAEQALKLKQKVDADLDAEASRRATSFAAILKRSQLEKKQLDDAKKLAATLKNFGKEPSTRQGTLLKAAGDIVEQGQEVAAMLAKFKELATVKEVQTVIGTAKKMDGTCDKFSATANAVNALTFAVALLAFVAAIGNAVAKLGAKR